MNILSNKRKNFFSISSILIIISFVCSVFTSIYFVSKYDKYQKDNLTHIMLKEETFYHWLSAAKIVNQVKSGENFFIAGEEVLTKPLPQRLVAIYSWITDFKILSNDNKNLKVNLGSKLGFLITQSLVYYLSLLYFYKIIKVFFPEKNCLYIIAFLAFEPNLFFFIHLFGRSCFTFHYSY